jgi:tRNA wybutosine-synthesizing protein 1
MYHHLQDCCITWKCLSLFINIAFTAENIFITSAFCHGKMDPATRDLLQKHQYRLSGRHSAVKICTWTKNSIRGKGVCYKQKFYGINSHRCVQMSPAVGFCQNRCVFCWRPIELTEGIEMKDWDEPGDVIEKCLKGQRELLTGFGGNERADTCKLEEADLPLHFAISLTGEPTLYPRLNELIRLLHSRGFSTFVVTNGMEPGILASIEPPTQLYLSVDAPTQGLFRKIDQPVYGDGWQRLQESL